MPMIRTGTWLPSLRRYSFSNGEYARRRWSRPIALASSGRCSGGVSSIQLSRPASRSSREYPTIQRNASLASRIAPSRSPTITPMTLESKTARRRSRATPSRWRSNSTSCSLPLEASACPPDAAHASRVRSIRGTSHMPASCDRMIARRAARSPTARRSLASSRRSGRPPSGEVGKDLPPEPAQGVDDVVARKSIMATPCDSYHSIQKVMLNGEDVGEAHLFGDLDLFERLPEAVGHRRRRPPANSDSVRTVSEVVGEAPKDRACLAAPEPPPATPAFFQVAGLVSERSAALGGGRDGSVARRPSTLLPEPGNTFRLLLDERVHAHDADPTVGHGARVSARRAVDVDRHDGRRAAGGGVHPLQRDASLRDVRVVTQEKRVEAVDLGRHAVLHRHEDAGNLRLAFSERSIELGVNHV